MIREKKNIQGGIAYETRRKGYVPLSVNWVINELLNYIVVCINAILIGRNLFQKKYKCYYCKHKENIERR